MRICKRLGRVIDRAITCDMAAPVMVAIGIAIIFLWANAIGQMATATHLALIAKPVGRSEPPCGAVRFSAERWHDADTPVDVRVYLPLGVVLEERGGLRIDNADAWEIGSRPGQTVTDAEREKGRRAVLHLRDTFDESEGWIELNKAGRDKYGRPLGRVWLRRESDRRWVDVGEWLRANGHDRSGS